MISIITEFTFGKAPRAGLAGPIAAGSGGSSALMKAPRARLAGPMMSGGSSSSGGFGSAPKAGLAGGRMRP